MLRGANETGKRISPVIKMPVLAVITALIFRPLGRRGFESLRPLQTISGLGKHASVGSSGAFCFLGLSIFRAFPQGSESPWLPRGYKYALVAIRPRSLLEATFPMSLQEMRMPTILGSQRR